MADSSAMLIQTFTHNAMATRWTIRTSGAPAAETAQAVSEAFAQISKLENLLSRFIASSDISRVNALAPGERAWVQRETLDCLAAAQKIAEATKRAFDATSGTLVDFWKTQTQNPSCAENSFCDEMPEWRAAVENFRFGTFALHAESQEIECVSAGAKIDLGGIAKGFALDCAAQTLEAWGVESALLSAGGSTILACEAPEGRDGWKIGFAAETNDPEHAPAPVILRKNAISSSGTQFQKTHLVDPRTGLLAIRRETVRVLAQTATEADALSTAFFCMSDAEIEEFLKSAPAGTEKIRNSK